jgi:geranylgeranyl diphosphate synthase, type II
MPSDEAVLHSGLRPPQDNIPAEKMQRDQLLAAARSYVAAGGVTPPLSLEELKGHSLKVLAAASLDPRYLDFAAVVVNNEAWRSALAAIPFERRLILLPKCLRDSTGCKGQFDQFGLICSGCGGCVIDSIQRQAEALGYSVLVAEGSPVVMSMIESGQIEAVIGASCLSVLEKTFGYMEAAAVPGIAIPLLFDGCKDTAFDLEWLWEAMYLCEEPSAGRINAVELRDKVDGWFSTDALAATLGRDAAMSEAVLAWMQRGGKRHRPFLTAGVYQALSGDASMPQALRKAAVAVECFHKASLIHDDIEDDDRLRYDRSTLHVELGVPIALNVGDYLIGEGYRLLAELTIDPDRRVRMLQVAAVGHRQLCIGQGAELISRNRAKAPTVEDVIEIFRCKTAPAFEVALSLGAILAGADPSLMETLRRYSDALGIAYQIRDDLDDYYTGYEHVDPLSVRASILLALGLDGGNEEFRRYFEAVWSGKVELPAKSRQVEDQLWKCAAVSRAEAMMQQQRARAVECLAELTCGDLKALLRRVVCKLFDDIGRLRCCHEYTKRHDPRGGSGQNPSA